MNPDQQMNPDQPVNSDHRINPIFVVSFPSFKMTPLIIPSSDETGTETGNFQKPIEFTLVGNVPQPQDYQGSSNG